MSESRLYLYRKAGREVWDAEMWLPDGRRRVWRTGMVDRDEAEQAAKRRLEALLTDEPAVLARAGAAKVSAGGSGNPTVVVADARKMPFAAANTLPLISATTSAGQDAPSAPTHVAKAHTMGWTERFDRWFFGDLALLRR